MSTSLRVGVIADTHNLLRPEALEALEVVHSWRRQSVAKMLERLDAVQVTSFLEVLSTLAHSPHSASADPEAPALP